MMYGFQVLVLNSHSRESGNDYLKVLANLLEVGRPTLFCHPELVSGSQLLTHQYKLVIWIRHLMSI